MCDANTQSRSFIWYKHCRFTQIWPKPQLISVGTPKPEDSDDQTASGDHERAAYYKPRGAFPVVQRSEWNPSFIPSATNHYATKKTRWGRRLALPPWHSLPLPASVHHWRQHKHGGWTAAKEKLDGEPSPFSRVEMLYDGACNGPTPSWHAHPLKDRTVILKVINIKHATTFVTCQGIINVLHTILTCL